VLTRSAATADEISGGRITLGMGAGWMEREHDAYGFAFGTARERIARLAEQVEIAHGLLHEERFDFEGTYYRLQDAPGLGRPNLPILVGGSAKPGTTGPAVRFADEYNTLFGTLDEVRERKQALDAACEQGGRDPAHSATHSWRHAFSAVTSGGHESARRIGARFGRDPKDVLLRYGERGPVGTVDQAIEHLKQIEELGYERVMLQHLAPRDLETVALIGRELAPAVA
jgi:Coenzyme F420-dependent N5,N10-methylene tetrahydromethanopterin reductase and related flavin-dependent oxidoreductases